MRQVRCQDGAGAGRDDAASESRAGAGVGRRRRRRRTASLPESVKMHGMGMLATLVLVLLFAPVRGSNVFTMDCQGGVHIWTGGNMEVNLNVKGVMDAVNTVGEQWLERAQCACPDAADEEELVRRFVPSLEFFLSGFTHQDAGNGTYAVDPITQVNSCASGSGHIDGVEAIFNAVSSAFQADRRGNRLDGIAMAPTCTYETLMSGQGCQFTLQGMQNNSWLKDTESYLEVVLDKCDDSLVWPFVSVQCNGPGCNEVFVQPCDTDSDCTSDYQTCRGFFGTNTSEFLNLMTKLRFTDGLNVNECAESGYDTLNSAFAKVILENILGATSASVDPLSFKTCTGTFYEFADFARQTFLESDSSDSSSSDIDLSFLTPFAGKQVFTNISDPSILLDGFDVAACAAQGCHPSHLGDGYCNPLCNIPECLYDGNECANCACVSGTDFSSCNRNLSGSGFFYVDYNGNYLASTFPAASPSDDACSVDTSGLGTPWEISNSSCTITPDPTYSSPEWFCSIDGALEPSAETLFFPINNSYDAFDCMEGDYRFARQRTCICAFPADLAMCNNGLSIPWDGYSIASRISFLGLNVSADYCGEILVIEDCPYAHIVTVEPTEGLLGPLEKDPSTFDKNGDSLFTPEIAPEETNVLYTTCDGTLVFNLFNPFFSFGISMPRLNTVLSYWKDAVRVVDMCASMNYFEPTSDNATVAFDFWKPAFWLETLMPGDYLNVRAETNQSLGGYFAVTEPMTFPNANSLTVENLLAGPLEPVRFTLKYLADLFDVSSFQMNVEVDTCNTDTFASELSQLKIAIDAPFIFDVVNGLSSCSDTLLDTCPGTTENFFCANFTDLLVNLVGSLDEFEAGFFNVFVWREAAGPDTLCQNADNRFVLLSARKFLFDLVFSNGTASSTSVPSQTDQLLLACMPGFLQTIDTLFEWAQVSCETYSGTSYTCADGTSVDDCVAQWSDVGTVTTCDGVVSSEPYTNCSYPISQKSTCDTSVCMATLSSTEIIPIIFYSGYYAYTASNQMSYMDSFTDCVSRCYEDYSNLGLPLSCHRTASTCTQETTTLVSCSEETHFAGLYANEAVNVSTFSNSTTCPMSYPYYFFVFDSDVYACCNRNDDEATAYDREVGTWTCSGDVYFCDECVSDFPFVTLSNVEYDYCLWDAQDYPCTANNNITVKNEGVVESYTELYANIYGYANTLEGCELFRAVRNAAGIISTGFTSCTLIVESTCATISDLIDCTETGSDGSGVVWLESYRTKTGTDAYGSMTYSFSVPVEINTTVPGSVYDRIAPVPVSAVFTPSGDEMEITFDSNTNEQLSSAGALSMTSCGSIFVVSSDDSTSSLACYWASSTALKVSIDAKSLVSIGDELSFIAGNGIRSSTGYSTEVSGTLAIEWDSSQSPPTPVIELGGVSEVSPCEGVVSLTGTIIGGAAGRALTWNLDVYSATDSLSTSIFTATYTTPLMEFTFDMSGVVTGESYIAVASATNWLGETSNSSAFTFYVATNDIPTIQIDNPRSIFAIQGVTKLTLDASTRFLCGSPLAKYVYAWSWRPISASAYTYLRQGASSAHLKLAADTFTPGTYRLRVTTQVVGDNSTIANDEITVTVTTPEYALVPRGGYYRAIFVNEVLIVDFSSSCDPAAALGCSPIFGAVSGTEAATTKWTSSPTVEWICTRSDNVGCGLELPTDNSFVLNVAGSSLDALLTYEFSIIVNGAHTSSAVKIDVRPESSASCEIVPRVAIAPVDPILSVPSAGVILHGSVSGYTAGATDTAAVRLHWQRIIFDETTNTTVAQSAAKYAARINRPHLVLRKSALAPGVEYTFRLTAIQACAAEGNYPFAQVTFTVNKAPNSGYAVEAYGLTTGFAYETTFTFVAVGFSDDDTPLTYSFEYTFDEPTGIVAPEDTYTLGPYSASPTLRTSLELPAAATGVNSSGTIYITVVARDSLGAESHRTDFLAITLRNPIKSLSWTPFVFGEVLQAAIAQGCDRNFLLRDAMCMSSLANAASNMDSSSLQVWATTTRRAAFAFLEQLDTSDQDDPDLLALQIGVLSNLVGGNPGSIDQSFQEASIELLRLYIQQANQTLQANTRADDDPTAFGILPSSVQDNALESLTQILAAARGSLASSARLLSGRARVLSDTAICEVVSLTRTTIEELALLSLQGYVQGATARQFQSTGIQMATARESTAALGTGSEGGDGLSSISLPSAKKSGKSVSAGSGNAERTARGSFILPADIISGMEFNGSEPSAIDLIAVSYGVNIRCESIYEVILIDSNGNEEQCNLTEELVQYTGPVSEITDVVSLSFVSSTDSSQTYDPTGLSKPIVMQLPRNNILDTDLCSTEVSNATEIVCGYYDPEQDEWSTAGCALSANQTDPENAVTCECSHASDYAVWQAFTQDVRNTFSNPITAVTSLALLVLGVFFPTMVFVWLIGMAWARRRDKLDAESIQKGVIGMMYLRRMQVRAQQRKFFDNMREMIHDEQHVTDLNSYKVFHGEGKSLFTGRPLFNRSVCKNFFLAVVYEHSLIGLIKYDAHYSRTQRVSVFVAICMGNALAAAIFFELKSASDITFGFLVAAVLLSSLFVSIPVRILIKSLFRVSDLKIDSDGSRVSTAFRALSRIEERNASSVEEVNLLLSYSQVFRLRAREAALKAQIRLEKRGKQQVAQLVTESVSSRSDAIVATVKEDNDLEVAHITLEELAKQLADVHAELHTAKLQLLERTQAANRSWKHMRTEDAVKRIRRIRKQKSALLRVAALMSDEARTVGKARRPLLSSFFVYVAWFIVFSFYAFAVYYITRFVLTRVDIANSDDEENEIILTWLTTAAMGVLVGYLFAEPVVFFIRYALLPYLLIKFGRNLSAQDFENDDDAASEVSFVHSTESAATEVNLTDGESAVPPVQQKARFRIDKYLYKRHEKNEGKKREEGDNMIILEMAADLLEAGM